MSATRPRLAIVTMQFPVPSETFLSREILALGPSVEIAVHTLKGLHPRRERIAAEQGVDGVVTYPPFADKRRLWQAVRTFGMRRIMALARLAVTDRALPPSVRLRYLAALPSALLCALRIAEQRPDIVHAYWGHYPSLVLCLLAGRSPATRHTLGLSAYDLARAGSITREAARTSAAVFTLARANIGAVAELAAGSPVRVVHHGIDLAAYPPADALPAKDPLRIVTAGRLLGFKRFDLVLDAFALVLASRPEARLDLVGDGPERDALQRQAYRLGIADSVRFHGWLAPGALRDMLLDARMFLLLSQWERIPNVIKEAMAAGCVCISSHTPGMEEIICDGSDGYLVADPADSSAVAARMLAHLGKAETDPMQLRAAARIRAGFDVRRTVSGYLEVWLAP
ncbi:glycosyltransferase [Pelagibacterium lacus]|nr:glycosyltransferase [Pelagibacterium lacus]